MTTFSSSKLTDALPQVGHRYESADHWVEVYARANLPTRFGDYVVLVFRNSVDDKEHLAMVRGLAPPGQAMPVRVHSECLTGDVLASLRCDCRGQLERVMEHLGQQPYGALLYMRQEGRGIGLGNKIRAYALQEQGMDTFEANEHLGFDADLRDYRVAAMMLRAIGVDAVQLATNNPRKIFGLRAHGIVVSQRAPLIIEGNPHNSSYLASKARAGHLIPDA